MIAIKVLLVGSVPSFVFLKKKKEVCNSQQMTCIDSF